MDIRCQKCGEPWDDYYLTHELGLEHLEEEGFTVAPLPCMPEEEMIEGHLMILSCPGCPRQTRALRGP